MSLPVHKDEVHKEDDTDAMRQVHCGDALAWLAKQPDGSLPNVLTSLPDWSETKIKTRAAYEAWFVKAVDLILRKTNPKGYAIFLQTDRKTAGEWLAKDCLLQAGSEKAGVPLRWHKIVLRKQLNIVDTMRPTYSHLMAFSKRGRPGKASPDVIPFSARTYNNGMGVQATEYAVNFIKKHSGSKEHTIVDPFSGRGTVLAVANNAGMRAIGVDILPSQCAASRKLRLPK